jgi:hypothetical protein
VIVILLASFSNLCFGRVIFLQRDESPVGTVFIASASERLLPSLRFAGGRDEYGPYNGMPYYSPEIAARIAWFMVPGQDMGYLNGIGRKG